MKRVPITKLKSRLAFYLGRLKSGESFIVTDRGIPVARFDPFRLDPEDPLAELVMTGVVRPPEKPEAMDDFLATMPKTKDPKGRIRQALLAERGENLPTRRR